MSDSRAVRRPEPFRRLSLAISGCSQLPAWLTVTEEAARWYAGADARRLAVDLRAPDAGSDTLRAIGELLERLRRHNDFFKQDPPVVLAFPIHALSDPALDAIEAMDDRSPRLTLMAVWRDADGFAALREELETARERLSGRHLLVQPCFQLDRDWLDVESLLRTLVSVEQEGGPLARFVLARCPVVEASWAAACADLERFLDLSIDLWCRFPVLNDAVALSQGGALREFYRAKEMWALARAGAPLAAGDLLESGGDTPAVAARKRALRASVRRRLSADPGLYRRCRGTSKRVTLDQDWDFVFDSYECQSPIFAAAVTTVAAVTTAAAAAGPEVVGAAP